MPEKTQARQYMSKSLVTLRPDMDVIQAVHLLVEHKISGAPVLDDHGNIVGMLTERDCMEVVLKASYHGELGGQVEQYMSRVVRTVDVDSSLLDLAQMFVNSPYRRYPVMDGNRLVGIISRRDMLRAVQDLAHKGI
ncbi:MAG: CBS domain-containing protein [Chromatiales bacterium]|jgi:CBS domain-containing protein|nr:CBS domain-containing protein [Chromatiales bacterium]MDH4013276.1 CBS domain-containing protein [Chromatiales bacterium]PLX56052.1 MAG: CBS domain-containing protein [Chromatiales bacterium]